VEAAKKEEKQKATGEGKKGKGTWGGRIVNFMMYGGFLLVLVVLVAIVIIISTLTGPLPDKGVTILNPKPNDVVKAGDSYVLLWKAEPTELEFGTKVTVEFSKDGGKSWQKVEENVPNKGKYMWNVPNVDSTKCKVRIFSQFKPRYRGTSKVFSVK
jgi:hypothetical protein